MRFLGLLLGALAGVVAADSEAVRGISLFGLETQYKGVMCTWQHDVSWYLKRLEELGFNTIRLPFSYKYVVRGDWTKMDEVFDSISQTNLNIVLDYHRLYDEYQSAKPYTDDITFDQFLGSWNTILKRYGNHTKLIGIDAWNEYQGTNSVEWNNLARQILDYIETRYGYRNLTYWVQGTNWAGNIHDLKLNDLPYFDRIRLVIHKYHFSDVEPLEKNWDWSLGIGVHNTSQICVGEWGFQSDHPDQVRWAERFVDYLKSRNITDSFFWAVSWNSGDTGGIFLEDCQTVDCRKMKTLRRYWST